MDFIRRNHYVSTRLDGTNIWEVTLLLPSDPISSFTKVGSPDSFIGVRDPLLIFVFDRRSNPPHSLGERGGTRSMTHCSLSSDVRQGSSLSFGKTVTRVHFHVTTTPSLSLFQTIIQKISKIYVNPLLHPR